MLITQHKAESATSGWLEIIIMRPSGATCLSVDYCFSELALWAKSNYKSDRIIITLKINLFSPRYSWKITELALNNNHSLTHTIEFLEFTLIYSYLSENVERMLMLRLMGCLFPFNVIGWFIKKYSWKLMVYDKYNIFRN